MKVQIYIFPQHIRKGKLMHDIVPTHLGYAEVETFDTEHIWHLCNWACWAEEKPKNLYADIEFCGHGLCVINPETQEIHLALSVGWLIGNEKKISDYVLNNRYEIVWKQEHIKSEAEFFKVNFGIA
jgi:hypothetical protein